MLTGHRNNLPLEKTKNELPPPEKHNKPKKKAK